MNIILKRIGGWSTVFVSLSISLVFSSLLSAPFWSEYIFFKWLITFIILSISVFSIIRYEEMQEDYISTLKEKENENRHLKQLLFEKEDLETKK